jgi:succinate dehydrogenase / fumarate reductase flavoprotein subunit
MERYAPHAKELASRDVVSRAIATEVREGRGCGPDKDHVLLKLEHLGEEIVAKRLPGIRETVKTFMHVDPAFEPIPVFPTAHYVMGGIPTDLYAQVLGGAGASQEVVPGLYAAGECACVSIHGANRLGGNSLLDLLVFGRAAGLRMLDFLHHNPSHRPLDEAQVDKAMSRLARWEQTGDGETVPALRNELKRIMETHCGVFRTAELMQEGVRELAKLRERMPEVRLQDHSKIFNTARIEALELENLMDIAMATLMSAEARQESRGAHSRVDFPERDDANWLQHTLYFLQDDRIDFRPVRIRPLSVETFPPKPRVY